MGRIRATLRTLISIGGYDGISPIAKQNETNQLLTEIRDGKKKKPQANPYLYDWSKLGKKN